MQLKELKKKETNVAVFKSQVASDTRFKNLRSFSYNSL